MDLDCVGASHSFWLPRDNASDKTAARIDHHVRITEAITVLIGTRETSSYHIDPIFKSFVSGKNAILMTEKHQGSEYQV
jgi:hypothetical protein